MIDARALLTDLKKLLTILVADLSERCGEGNAVDEKLRAEHAAAKAANRAAEAYETWRGAYLTQVAAAWILSCVFVRFLEDNGLVDEPRLAGPGERLDRARDHHTLYFQQHPMESDREYLESVFRAVAALPAAGPLLDAKHNPLWQIGVSGDSAARLLEFWQRIDPATGSLTHDLTDPAWSTRFLGDLYQDLSEAARKQYALLQTPEFVEQFILDRTLTPAIDEFGWREVRLIDPTCGSGHFLLGAFHRLFDLWAKHEPATNPRELAQRALDQVYGVDINPYAVAIARFRLLVAALKAASISSLKDAPAFRVNLATGDSLLHGPRFAETRGAQLGLDPRDTIRHVYLSEDREELARILGHQYHAVVGNPPYITVKDKALNQAYRDRYGSCHRLYSLAVPFMERFFELALLDEGYVGMITANSFMKREFGKKLIEQYIPRWDVTHVIDTSAAAPSLAGHGTPTVILFGRNRAPVASVVRTVMGIRSESEADSEQGFGPGWRAIVDQVDLPGSRSEFLSVADMPRQDFHHHPWSIAGGGAAELKQLLDETGSSILQEHCDEIGFGAMTRDDEVYLITARVARRQGIGTAYICPLVAGVEIRDWAIHHPTEAIWPYDSNTLETSVSADVTRFLWPWRTQLARRVAYGRTQVDRGLRWEEYSMFFRDRFRTSFSIAFAFVATHNHFVLDRGAKVFKQTAPIVKLPPDSTEDDHLALLAVLNSSTACFWMKQTFFDRGGGGIGGGIASEQWEKFYEHDSTKLLQFPLVTDSPTFLAQRLDQLSEPVDILPSASGSRACPSASQLERIRQTTEQRRRGLIAWQEELDWECYRLYGLFDSNEGPLTLGQSVADGTLPPIELGERAFEIVMARKMAAGELETAWFERHNSTPLTEIPARLPESYREIIRRRIEAIETNPSIRLIEQPEYKRRWNTAPWEKQLGLALQLWLLDRLEDARHWLAVELATISQLADRVRQDVEFMRVAELYRGRADFEVGVLVAELVEAEAVPFLPVQRYKPSGLEKRALWERTWDLQRREDRGENVGEIQVPPKYTSADFQGGTYWSLRGKLDVPKERFVSYPHCERAADPSLVIGWAGWDHLQQAQALAGYYVRMKEQEGWSSERLTPLLTGLLELLPWLEQWHNDIDPAYGVRMGDHFRGFVEEEARALGVTLEQIRAWAPPKKGKKKN